MKYYQVIFVDEYNNFYELGNFRSLEDAEPEINEMLDGYILDEDEVQGENACFGPDQPLGRLTEYPSTIYNCFDRIIAVDVGCVQVRGFIKDTKNTIKEMKELEEGK